MRRMVIASAENHVVACYPPLHPNRGFAVCAEHKGCGIFCKDPLVLNAAGDDCVCPPGTTLHYNSAKHKYTCKHPTPSMRARALQHRSAMISQVLIDPRCPLSETACPLNFGSASSSTSGDGGYECIDTSNAVQSCGGCLGRGGVDCTAIEGVKGVGCEEGVCTVFSCEKGYMKTRDGCVKTSVCVLFSTQCLCSTCPSAVIISRPS
ncbi:hypothetical protein BT69DRAFT_952269 [Atractiella rhizophila]|nr:hypothetical protein BT69DRAFT_952269 [Atractiella rhizophila]